jgi:uncharacterized protein YigE (DUF2233 family)
MVIKNPKSETVTFSNRPSGVFFVNNKKNIFSDKVEINYTNGKEQTLEFVWENEGGVKFYSFNPEQNIEIKEYYTINNN